MAKVSPGPLAGLISGKVGNVVFSRGRYGAYIRSRVIPKLVQNDYTNDARGRLGTIAAYWKALTPAQQATWVTWVAEHPVIDRLGVPRVLQPSAAFIGVNCRIAQMVGYLVPVPSLAPAPEAPLVPSVYASVTGPFVQVSYASGSVVAGQRLAVWMAILPLGRSGYYRNRLKMIQVGEPIEINRWDVSTWVTDRFGTIVEDQVMKVELEVWDYVSGYVSQRAFCETVVVP